MSNLIHKPKLTQMDKIRLYLLGERKTISKEQKKMLGNYKKAFSYLISGKSTTKAIKLIEHDGYSYSHAAKIVRDAVRLFGDAFKYTRQGLKQIHYERFINRADKLWEMGEYEMSLKADDMACKIMDLYSDKNDGTDIAKLFQVNINLTSDPAALKQNTIDIEHTEEN